MNCIKCGTSLANGALFCHMCGTRAEPICINCGQKLMENAAFCAFCGTSVNKAPNSTIEKPQMTKHPMPIANKVADTSSPMNEDWLANDTSMYVTLGFRAYNSSYPHFSRIFYRGLIYFLSTSFKEVWSMCEDGTERTRLFARDSKDENNYIAVNSQGIFTYSDSLFHYSFDGSLISKIDFNLKKRQYIYDLFIMDTHVYYICAKENDEGDGDTRLMSVDIDGTNQTVLFEGKINKSYVHKVLATNREVLYCASYGDLDTQGWYRFDLSTGETVNLNSTILPPDEFLAHPKKFDCDSKRYVDDPNHVTIFGFDLINNIMWTFASEAEAKKMSLSSEKSQKTIFPRRIGIAPNQPILNNISPWNFPVNPTSNKYIFNGEVCYLSKYYHSFHAILQDGTISENWNDSGHGGCDRVQFTGNSLIGDICTNGGDYLHPLSFEVPDESQIMMFEGNTPLYLNKKLIEETESWHYEYMAPTEKAHICSNVTEEDFEELQDYGKFMYAYRYFTVDEDNDYFFAENGSLYNANKTKLYRFARDYSSKQSDFALPNTVEEICKYAFSGNWGNITIPNSVTKLKVNIFNGATFNTLTILNSFIELEVETKGNDGLFDCNVFWGSTIETLRYPKGSNIKQYVEKYKDFIYISNIEEF